MDWQEIIVHTTTPASDAVSDLLTRCGATGTMIEDRAEVPDPDKPHGYWELIEPALIGAVAQLLEKTPAARIGTAAVQHLAHLFHPTGDGAQRVKWHLGLLGNDASQRGLAHTGRTPQDERRDIAALYHAAYHRALAHEVPLPYVVVERLGTQTLGKWFIHDKSR